MPIKDLPFGELIQDVKPTSSKQVVSVSGAKTKVKNDLKSQKELWNRGIRSSSDFPEGGKKVRLWYSAMGDGNYSLKVKYGNRDIPLTSSEKAWVCGDWDKLGEAFDYIAGEIDAGNLDKEIETAWKAAKAAAPGRPKSKK